MDNVVQRLMDDVDSAGAPPMSKNDWKAFLERPDLLNANRVSTQMNEESSTVE